ncbi:hypothetical protein CQA66_08280 [Helicobacter aurati]|uniref:YopX protein domain-containing protein n=1 Tax=Helicobacter aurati TaxID=137778 RepID=A0A3D8IZR4_9HELI|nr:YopX family protein [Helicobacter aurati]RDU70395.1 hypothetical protein CQA66_08280 [Helicobacter aurati]
MILSNLQFRVWNKNKKEFSYSMLVGSEVNGGGDNLVYFVDFISKEYLKSVKEVDYDLDLWTGIKDNIGNKIYVNDIVKFENIEYLVLFDYGFILKGENKTRYLRDVLNNLKFNDFEVIGNIRQKENKSEK